MKSRALVGLTLFVVVLAFVPPAVRAASELSPADRASIENLLASLGADPLAEDPMRALIRTYERGPGATALLQEVRRRATAKTASLSDVIVWGRLELDRGRRGDGLRAIGRAVTLTRDPGILRRLGRILDEGGDRQGAIYAYQAGRAGATPLELRGLELRLGALWLAQGKTKEARAAWDEAKRLAPSDQALRRQIAESFASRGAYRDALGELREIEPLVENDPNALVVLLRREADLCYRARDRLGSEQGLLRAYERAAQAEQVSARADLTADLFRLHRADKDNPPPARKRGLTELLAVAEKAELKTPAAAALVGDVLAERGDATGAIAALRRALAAHPNDPYVLRRLAAIETGEARARDLSTLFDREKNDPIIGFDLIDALFGAHAVEQGLQVARELRARFPDNTAVLAQIAYLLSKHGQHAQALGLTEKVLALDPDHPDAAIAYADELIAVGRLNEATTVLWRLVAQNRSVTSYRQLVTILEKRRLDAAVKRAFGEALDHFPDEHLLRRDFARWLAQAGAIDESVAQWKQIEQRTQEPFLRDFAQREIKRLEWQKMLNR
jgi:tetratricopeptide (TPR) repeat protein